VVRERILRATGRRA